MSSSHKFLKLSSFFWPRKASPSNIGRKNHFLYASFCAIPESSYVAETTNIEESPELPDWVKYCEHDKASVNESKDDFVLPKIAEWATSRKLSSDHSKLVKDIAAEIVDSDLNKLSEVLKAKFDSVDEVGSVLSECDKIELSESLVEKILLRFRHDWVPAFGFFNWAKHQVGYTHTENSYNLMVDILGMSRNFELMWELIEEMDKLGGLVSFFTLTKAMRRLAKGEKYDEAVEAFDKFERFGLPRETAAMNMLIEVLVKEGNVERAQKVYTELKDKIPPNSHTFNILIHGWCKATKYTEARQTMADMEKHGFQPDVYSYTCFVDYYCREKDFRKVDAIVDEMQQKGCSPNVVTYTIIMRALGNAKETNKALEICHKMKQSGCDPDASFCSALIYILSKSGRFKDACDVFEDMPKGVADVLTYNTMIAAACKHSREEYAIELLKQMEETSCKPNLKTYTPLLKLCCEKKRMKVLNYLLSDMFRKGVSLDLSMYCLLVDHLCKNGKLEHACSFFEQMVLKRMVPRDNTYKLLMEKLEQKAMGKAKQQIEKLMLKAKDYTCSGAVGFH
ncbi:hypothetical protein RND81_05G221000 [Saponaria officinalis]|uniref:Pentatricopeptide repeat-containing protein n=1 Tax=Saponaria officinalis TaxID=3572 RepID=A0AAW1L131_SAPOF